MKTPKKYVFSPDDVPVLEKVLAHLQLATSASECRGMVRSIIKNVEKQCAEQKELVNL